MIIHVGFSGDDSDMDLSTMAVSLVLNTLVLVLLHQEPHFQRKGPKYVRLAIKTAKHLR